MSQESTEPQSFSPPSTQLLTELKSAIEQTLGREWWQKRKTLPDGRQSTKLENRIGVYRVVLKSVERQDCLLRVLTDAGETMHELEGEEAQELFSSVQKKVKQEEMYNYFL